MRRAAPWVAGLLIGLPCGPADAHPQDEVVQGAYLTLAPGEIRVQLDLIAGPNVVGSVLSALDANADRRISEDEARAYANRVLGQSSILVDGKPVSWQLQKIEAPPYENIELAGDTVTIFAVAKRSDQHGARSFTYENRYDPATCLCIANVFLEPGAGWQYRVTGQKRSDDGRMLSVSYASAKP